MRLYFTSVIIQNVWSIFMVHATMILLTIENIQYMGTAADTMRVRVPNFFIASRYVDINVLIVNEMGPSLKG